MADLDLELAMKIISTFYGSHKDETPFLKCIELVHQILKTESKPEFV